MPLNELSKKIVREKMSTCQVANKTLTNVQSCFRSALNDAVEDEILESNPLSGWAYKNREQLKEEDDVDPFIREEQLAILAAARGDTWPQLRFSFGTGLRPSELIALEWGDIDWIAGEIRIVKAKTRAAKEPESTKTKELTFLAGGRVFLNTITGEPWKHAGYIYRIIWMPAMKKSGVRCQVAATLSESPHLCLHDAISWRKSNVGSQAARPQRLDPDRQGSWSPDALR